MLKEYCKSFSMCVCEVDFGVVQKPFKCGVSDTMREKFEDQHPYGICSSLCGSTLHVWAFTFSSCQPMLLTWAVEIGNGEERCGAGQEGSGWSSTLIEGDLPRFRWTLCFLNTKAWHGQAVAPCGLSCGHVSSHGWGFLICSSLSNRTFLLMPSADS